jgi:aerobic carbon-monoxide dehydrogenase large subunit
MDYALPRADMLPSFTTRIAEVLSPTNPLGIKAGGEGGTTAAPAVIINAIVDALGAYGVAGPAGVAGAAGGTGFADIKMPATPFRVWKLIADAKAREGRGGEREPRRNRR